MKRIFLLVLTLSLLLLCACDGSTVPVYDSPSVMPPPTEEVHASETLPLKIAVDDSSFISDLSEVTTKGKDDTILRLMRQFYVGADGLWANPETLSIYDRQRDCFTSGCQKKNCPHVDENCGAWLGDSNGLYFAVKDSTAYVASGTPDNFGSLLDLKFFTLDLTTGEEQIYYEIPGAEGQSVHLGDVLVCGNTVVMSYDIAHHIYDYEGRSDYKMHHILAIDLLSGELTRVMEREVYFGDNYDLWGMNEERLILAFHAGGMIQSYGAYIGSYLSSQSAYGYDEYIRDQHRWVLLEYPIEENAKWSKHIIANDSANSLNLYSYSNFYEGTLYYVSNDCVMSYDLDSRKMQKLFSQPGICHMSCFDGKIFYETTDGKYFWYDLSNSDIYQYPEDPSTRPFFIVEESDDGFFGSKTPTRNDFCHIDKEDFYQGNYEEALPLYWG